MQQHKTVVIEMHFNWSGPAICEESGAPCDERSGEGIEATRVGTPWLKDMRDHKLHLNEPSSRP